MGALAVCILAYLIGSLPPVLLAVALLGCCALVIALVHPIIVLPLLLFAVPFGSTFAIGGGSSDSDSATSVGVTEFLAALLVLAWLVSAVRTRQLKLSAQPIFAAALFLIALMLYSVTYALSPAAAVKESLKWIELLLVALATLSLAPTRALATSLVVSLLLAGSLEALWGIAQTVTGSGPSVFALQGNLRAFGNFDQPNPFGGYLSMIFPVALAMALTPANTRRVRIFATGASLSLMLGILLSQSRGAWLGVLTAAIVLFALWSRSTRALLVPGALLCLFGVALLVTGVLPPGIADRITQIVSYFGVFDVRTVELTGENFAIVERMAHWQAGWYMFLDHQWLGVGAGNYAEAYPGYYVGDWLNPLGHAHNYYLNMLAELGVCGLALLLVFLYLVFRRFLGALRLSAPLTDLLMGARMQALAGTQHEALFWRALLAGVLGSMIVFCMHNLFDNLFVHGVNVQLGLLLGLGVLATNYLRGPLGLGNQRRGYDSTR